MVTEPGIYQMPIEEYVKDPAPQPSVNAGTALALLTQSPRHAWTTHPRVNPDYQSEQSSRLDLGTIAHALLLEGDRSRVVVVEADDWRTKAAKEQRDAARAEGKLPILQADYDTVNEMVISAECAIAESELFDAWASAIPEQTLIWEEDGVWFRSRPDKLTPDYRVAFDFKTCGGTAHPAAFGRGVLISNGYDLQAALAVKGITALKNPQSCTFIFVCQEIDPPYAVSFVSLAPQFLAIANERVTFAKLLWSKCLAEDRWPAYPSRVCYVDPPGFYGMDAIDLSGEERMSA